MKKIAKISVFLFVSALAAATLTSCSDNSVSPFDTTDDTALADFLFLATAGDSLSSNGAGGHHGNHGGWRGGDSTKCNVTEVDVTTLPAAITDYVAANYTGATVSRAGTLSNGNYIVKIDKADGTHSGLLFDANGTFLEEKTHAGPGTQVAAADLPAAINDYIAANYAGATVAKAFVSSEGKYMVVINKTDGTHVGLGFEANGTFIAEIQHRGKGSRKGGKKH